MFFSLLACGSLYLSLWHTFERGWAPWKGAAASIAILVFGSIALRAIMTSKAHLQYADFPWVSAVFTFLTLVTALLTGAASALARKRRGYQDLPGTLFYSPLLGILASVIAVVSYEAWA